MKRNIFSLSNLNDIDLLEGPFDSNDSFFDIINSYNSIFNNYCINYVI